MTLGLSAGAGYGHQRRLRQPSLHDLSTFAALCDIGKELYSSQATMAAVRWFWVARASVADDGVWKGAAIAVMGVGTGGSGALEIAV